MPSERSSTPTCLPKPCLKQMGKVYSSQQKHAHFPPPSEEAKRYSGLDYDRTPIVVLVNECALPARGERTLDDIDMPKSHRAHHHHHPKESRSTKSAGNARGSNIATSGSVGSISYNLTSNSTSISKFMHADSDDSDDGVALPIGNNGLQVYRHALAPDLDKNLLAGVANASQSRRLRKSPSTRSHGRMTSHEARNSSTESFSAFAPDSCLGGF